MNILKPVWWSAKQQCPHLSGGSKNQRSLERVYSSRHSQRLAKSDGSKIDLERNRGEKKS